MMLSRTTALMVAVGAGLVAACSGHDQTPKVSEPPPAIAAAEMVQGEATIVAVDRARRSVELRGADGKPVTVKVGPDVDLSRVTTGDRVDVVYAESVVIDFIRGSDQAPSATGAVAVARRDPGQLPGGGVAEQTTVTVAVAAIDLKASSVTIRGPAGNLHTVTVKNPELQARLPLLKVGDLVQITYTEAVAVAVNPKPKA
jgi:hypothetical protein